MIESDRTVWIMGEPQIRSGSIIFYTDGSKENGQVGADVTGLGV